jgi:hypothetical protein
MVCYGIAEESATERLALLWVRMQGITMEACIRVNVVTSVSRVS